MKTPAVFPHKILLPRGFLFAGVSAGIKPGRALDVGLVDVRGGATGAALFTSNRVVAAPLVVDRRHLRVRGGRVRAVIVNSGNANCATGAKGLQGCERVCARLARLLGASATQVFPSSTGVIGIPLPAGRILAALPPLLARRRESRVGVLNFARAIMTTDTRPKLASARFRCGAGTATLLGVAKGAGMIHPQLATMLVYLFTDTAASPPVLRRLLAASCERTFNTISVDGDTSTNDTVLLLASGASGLRVRPGRSQQAFRAALESVCGSLAEQIVADGEGVRHLVRLQVEGARSRAEAGRVARAIAHSPLVKTAWAGADPNWGRILAAVGASGVKVDPNRINIFLGAQPVCRRGAACPFDERRAHRFLSRPTFTVRVQLGQGRAAAAMTTGDLTAEYIQLNLHYRH